LGEAVRRLISRINTPADMTVGTPWKCILTFAFPMLIGNMAQQLYNAVDSIVVGKTPGLGDDALAAVGNCGPILNLLLALFIGISAGASVMVAQYIGAKNREGVSRSIGNCITATALCCMILIAAATWLIRPALVALGTPEGNVLDWCADYLTISLWGIAGLAYYNILSGILRGMGDSFSALVYLFVGIVLNIGLDILFVAVFRLEVPGVAIATVISQCVTAALCMFKLARMKEYFDFGLRYMKPKGHYLKTLLRVGLPSGLTQAIFSSATIIVQRLTNSFGPHYMAANVSIMRVDGFAMMPNFSFGTAMTTYAGQNVGAGKYDRVMKGAKQGMLMAVACSASITVLILLFGKNLLGLFTDTAELVETSYRFMLILAVGYIAVAVTQSLSGIMRGAGDTMTPMWISLITTVLIRVPVAYGIAWLTATDKTDLATGQPWCIQVSLLCSWCLGALLTAIFYKIGRWKRKRIRQ